MKVLKLITVILLFCFLNSASAQIDMDLPQPTNDPVEIACGDHKIIYGVPYKNIKFCGTKEDANAFRRALAKLLNIYPNLFKNKFKSMFKCKTDECDDDETCIQKVHVYKISVTIPYYIGQGCYRLQIKPRIRATCTDCDKEVEPVDDEPHEMACGEHGAFAQTIASMSFTEGQSADEMIEILYEYYSIFPEELNAFVDCKGDCREGENCDSEAGLGGIAYDINENGDGGASISFNAEIEAECSPCGKIKHYSEPEIRTFAEKGEIHIHPNPSSGNFTVDLSKTSELANRRIEIYNLQGQLMYTQVLDKHSPDHLNINFTENSNGIYLLYLKSENSKNIMKKLIVE